MPVSPNEAADALAEIVRHLLDHAANHDDLDHLVAALDIVQHLCWNGVSLKDITEPVKMDAVQMALAAGVVERLVEVYSAPPHNLPQQAPVWCAGVPPSPIEVWLVSPTPAEGATLNPIFRRRNVVTLENFLSFA
ncbi:hypothetical protein [Magnetospirillum sulfuroxidans]|uniref:Uncharacterized protein n=1 Tax=Magnetospirillum sulfuroxidans TaxID=611300 RepID=A0ABS5ICA0_9PROT|nr:hypothetical protein [Magnetospirillum sulfuroxidans]MBR9972047.1 hypothetical protein [Magnetospirillum sulfuroxidans]